MEVEAYGFSIEGPLRSRRYLHALAGGTAETFMTALFTRSVGVGMVVLDVGAFLGQYALLAARAVGAGGRVYAFEPDPEHYEFLTRNVTRNGFSSRVVTVPWAVTDWPGERTLFLDPEAGGGSSLFYPRRIRVPKVSVRSVVLDEFLDDGLVVDVVKLDVEGGEVYALRGMEHVVARSPGMTLFVECFPRGLRRSGTGARMLVRQLEDLGFTVLAIDEKRRRLLPLGSGVRQYARFLVHLNLNALVLANLLCIRDPEHPALGMASGSAP